LYYPILELDERSWERQMTIDVTGGPCINPMGETVYTFLVIKQEEKKNIDIARYTRDDNPPVDQIPLPSCVFPSHGGKFLLSVSHFPIKLD